MKISIIGLGYVGCILTAGYTHYGYSVIGADIDQKKVDILNNGKSPVIEKGIDEYISKAKSSNKLFATTDAKHAVINTDLSFIAVGTPCSKNGEIDLAYTLRVCEDIANALKEKNRYHLIVFKSTLFPGTVENKLIPLLEKLSQKKAGKDFGICHNPEFLREGDGIYDFFNPPLTIIGEFDKKSGDMLYALYKETSNKENSTPIVRTNIKIGEMIKYANNSFHALKVAFANEIGSIAKACGVDSHEIMRYFCMDKLLNISSAYLKPGAPYGGSCLTKDLTALRFEANKMGMKTVLLDAIDKSNNAHIEYCTRLIEDEKKKNICILGLSFKEGTDDLRSSAIVRIISSLYKKGYTIKIYDPSFVHAELFGANKKLLEGEYSFLQGMIKNSLLESIEGSDIIVIKNHHQEYLKVKEIVNQQAVIIDFVRIFKKGELKSKYIGVSW